jgi:hypothetical protein
MDTSNTFTPWDGTQPVQVGETVIILMDDCDDFYGRVIDIDDGQILFRYTDKHGVNDVDSNNEDWPAVWVRHVHPYADPMPDRWALAKAAQIACFAPIAPLPFDESIDPRDAQIAALEARIAELEKSLRVLKRKAAQDADFEDWQTGRDR